jgi:heat-inducible transcriptional repressor
MENLTDRQKKLLKAIIQEFIETADAVASLHLSDKYNLPISSATIRNEMKSLSDAGMLRQMHTSSGRVPTTTGLRFFIEQLIEELGEIELLEQERVKQQIFAQRFSADGLIRESLKSLAKLSGNPTFALIGSDIYYAGLADMLEIPEFQELGKLQRILRILEDYSILLRIFNHNKSDRKVRILIGEEMGIAELADYAVVFAEIKVHGGAHGYLSVIGPNRMDYATVIPAVDYVSSIITQAVRGW